jgi:phage terminase large subunit-like protein
MAEQATFGGDFGSWVKPINKGGRPRLDDDEKRRRGTFEPGRSDEARTADPTVLAVPPRDYLAILAGYVAGVRDGSVPACTWVKLAIERQARDLAAAAADPAAPFVWSDAYVLDACHFLEQLPHTSGKWATPTITLAPFQVFFVALLFGWRLRADPTRRRFTVVYLELGRKGAKSTLMAGIALYHMLREDEPGASVVCGAATGSQARIVFEIAQKMIRRSAWLRAFGLRVFASSIFMDDGATMRPINAKASTQDGLNPSCIVLDESHAQSFKLHDVLKSAQGARQNPLLLCPTTAGHDLQSVGYALRGTLIKVLQGVVTADHMCGLIYTLDEGDDWREESTWIKAMPMIGTTPTLEWVRGYAIDAQATAGLEAEFRVKMCSQWANAASTWLSLTQWDACAAPVTLEQFEGEPCYIGADLAQLDDLAAVALVFERDGILYAFVTMYLPALVIAERARAVPEYRAWVKAGIVKVTDGNMIDFSVIEADIRAAARRFQVRDIVFDQFGSIQLAGTLANDGLPARIEGKNAKTCTPPARELETRVKHGKIRHDGNTCLRWQASNVVVTRRTDDTLVPKKEGAESANKIDAIDALLWAIGGWLRGQSRAVEYHMEIV